MLYINVAGLTNVAVANQSGCLFTRAAAGGLSAIVATLAERRSLTLEHSRMWLGHVGLATPLEDVEGDAELVAATRATLEEGVHQLADTIRNSLNFYRMQDNAENVERALLTGPAASIPGFAEQARRAAQPAGRDRRRGHRRVARGRRRPRAPDGRRGPGGRGPLARAATGAGAGC